MAQSISIQDLKLVVNSLFNHIENTLKVNSITLDEDLYWNIDKSMKYKVDQIPMEDSLSLGSLFDDLSELQRLNTDEEYINIMYFKYLSSIFSYLAETDEWFNCAKNS